MTGKQKPASLYRFRNEAAGGIRWDHRSELCSAEESPARLTESGFGD
jgi:hypothetical protein